MSMSLAAALVLTMAMVPAPTVSEYVALGDSYAAGVGSAQGAGTGCRRSDFGYPNLWKDAHSPASFSSAACSGATVRAVTDRQLRSLTSETDLVTITVGGNDAGFVGVMTTCTLSSDKACEQAVDRAEKVIHTDLPGRFERLFAAIKAAAPQAKIVVLGYPRLFEAKSCAGGLSEAKRAAVNDGADALASVTGAAAIAAGVTFVDVRDAFTGHGICGDDPWIHPLTSPVANSYHPTRSGQVGYLRALESAVPGLVGTQAWSR